MLALATSISAWIQVILLYMHLNRENFVYSSNIFNKEPFMSMISCIIMFLILSSIMISAADLAQKDYYMRGSFLGGYILIGALVYITSMYLFGYKFKRSLI